MSFRSRGVRALVILQMGEMLALFEAWKRAKRHAVRLPATTDPAYQNLDTLMRHPLRSCRGYLTWLCENLGRAEPRIPEPPEPSEVAAKGEAYLELLDAAWRKHMAWMSDRVLDSKQVFTTRWGSPITVEAMLEHALAHPMRHRLQLEELLAAKAGKLGAASKRSTRPRTRASRRRPRPIPLV